MTPVGTAFEPGSPAELDEGRTEGMFREERREKFKFQVHIKLFYYSLSPVTDKEAEIQKSFITLTIIMQLESTRTWI